jgi:hypothetical protein
MIAPLNNQFLSKENSTAFKNDFSVKEISEEKFRLCRGLISDARKVNSDLTENLRLVDLQDRMGNVRLRDEYAQYAQVDALELQGILDQVLSGDCDEALSQEEKSELQDIQKKMNDALAGVSSNSSNIVDRMRTIGAAAAGLAGILGGLWDWLSDGLPGGFPAGS